MSGSILFSPDNTYDIGASGATRPRNIYAAGSYYGGVGRFTYGVDLNSNGFLRAASDGALTQSNAAETVVSTLNGTLTTSTTSTCTTAVTTEEDLWTYSLPAGALSADGRGVRVKVFGTTAATATVKSVRGYFGATVAASSVGSSPNNVAWEIVFEVLRTAAATQIAYGRTFISTVTENSIVTTPAETLSGAVTIKLTGQNGTANANDICVKGAIVETVK